MERDKLISLVSKAKQGDPDALNDLFNAFYNDVYYFALKTVKDDQVACDVTQETFIEVINTLDQLEQEAAFVTWLKKITYHQCTRYFKKKKDVIVDEDEDGNTVFDTLQEEKADFIPEEALDKEDFKKTIMGMIDNLSEEQRAAVMMFYYDELSIKQIAEIQNTNENTVKSRLNYAKKGIKKSVEDYEKKNGVKLHCVGVLPLLLWLFKDYFAQSAPATATAVAEGVAAATGTTVTITATATTTATVTTTAATTTAVGVGAKIASLPIATKIIAGIVAASLVIGGATTAIVVNNNNNDDSSIVDSSGSDNGTHIYYEDFSWMLEEHKKFNPEKALEEYSRYMFMFYELPYFNSVDELKIDDAIRFAYAPWGLKNYDKSITDPILTSGEGMQKILKAIFGKEFDCSKPENRYATCYNDVNGDLVMKLINIDGSDVHENPELHPDAFYGNSGIIDNGDGTYSLKVAFYREKVDTLPEGIAKGEYVIQDNEDGTIGGYFILHSCGTITIEKIDGYWCIKSYTQSKWDPTEGSGGNNNNSNSTDTAFQYYDPYSRMHKSTLTIEDLGRRALANAEQTGGETYEDPPTAIYAVDYAASCFKDMDIFGYGVTVDEMCGLGWGGVDFFSNLIGEDMAVQLNNANFYLTLPLKEQAMGLKLAIKDVEAFTALLNGAGDPYVSIGGTSKRGLDNLTDEALDSAVDGSGSSPIEIFTSERFTVDGKEFGLSMTINSSMEDGVFCYRIGLSIYFFNE